MQDVTARRIGANEAADRVEALADALIDCAGGSRA